MHFNIEDGKNTQFFQHIMHYYFKKGKGKIATEMQRIKNKDLCNGWRKCHDR